MDFFTAMHYKIRNALKVVELREEEKYGPRRFRIAPKHKRRDFVKSKKLQSAVSYLTSSPNLPGKAGTPNKAPGV